MDFEHPGILCRRFFDCAYNQQPLHKKDETDEKKKDQEAIVQKHAVIHFRCKALLSHGLACEFCDVRERNDIEVSALKKMADPEQQQYQVRLYEKIGKFLVFDKMNQDTFWLTKHTIRQKCAHSGCLLLLQHVDRKLHGNE